MATNWYGSTDPADQEFSAEDPDAEMFDGFDEWERDKLLHLEQIDRGDVDPRTDVEFARWEREVYEAACPELGGEDEPDTAPLPSLRARPRRAATVKKGGA